MMRRVAKITAAVLMTLGTIAGTAMASVDTAAADGSEIGCPEGAVCLYTEEGFEDNEPEHHYYSYGVHRLYDEYGTHIIFNNQYGGATVSLNYGSDGSGPFETIAQDEYEDENLTIFNSITLSE